MTNRDQITPALLTRQQAADLAQVSTDRIDDWSHRGGFPVLRDGALVRIHRDEFDKWLRTEALKANARPEPIQLTSRGTHAKDHVV